MCRNRGAIAPLLAIACIIGPLAMMAWGTAREDEKPRADETPIIAPFSAHYSADWKSINVGTSDLSHLQILPIFGIIGVSLVVLTGWAGQISLGQFGLVGSGHVGCAGAYGHVGCAEFCRVRLPSKRSPRNTLSLP